MMVITVKLHKIWFKSKDDTEETVSQGVYEIVEKTLLEFKKLEYG